jgi:hypothetical protein
MVDTAIKWTLTAVAVAFFLTGCEEATTPHSQDRGRQIVPEGSDGIVLARQESTGLSIQSEEEEINPRVELPEEMLFITALDVNLDLDEPEEQIVVVKRRDDPDDRVRILVADFDTLRNVYRVTWEGVTLATNVRTFAVATNDLVGDHVDEIVGVGTDRQGRQTMDVFRRDEDTTSGVPGLNYRRVFSVATDGSIEIDTRSRSDAYRTLQSDGVSFPIDVYRQNQETETPLDLIRTRWSWNVGESRYVQTAIEEIPAVQIEEEQLRELYDAEPEDMEDYLQGPWFRSRGEGLGSNIELAYFDTELREIVLFHEDRQERYEWMNSYKTLYASGPGLWINLRNNVLSTVRRQLSLTVTGADTIQIEVDGVEYWNGNYQRMTSGIQSGILRRYALESPTFVLDGVYSNENGAEMVFGRPFFHFRTREIDWNGGYNLVRIDNTTILELKVVSFSELPDGIDRGDDGSFGIQYAVEYQEQQSEGGSIRRLSLRPVRVTVDGVQNRRGDEYVLEQVIERSPD